MSTSRYSELARSAALHENAGSLIQAAKLWRQANELALLKANVDWTAHRAHVCEARLRLAAKAALVKNGGSLVSWLEMFSSSSDLAFLSEKNIF